jgi:SAM-dependent methyltransferase
LARYFERVIATDASAEQIAQAEPDPKVQYRVADSASSGLADNSMDMVTVAQALHWLDLKAFYAEATRVALPGGAVVIWGYGDPILETEPLQKTLHAFNRGTIEEFWMPERLILLERYAKIPFPFREIETPQMDLEREWTLSELVGYLRTWSATANYVKQKRIDPIPGIESKLAKDWGEKERRRLIRWPLHIRAGYAD